DGSRRGASGDLPPSADREPDGPPPSARRGDLPRRLYRHPDLGPGARAAGKRGHAGARRAFPRVPLQRSVRVASDVAPLSHQRAGVRATMIHDLGPLRYPERLHPRTVTMHMTTAREAAGCDVVFTNSSFTANDVVERLGVPLERVRVAYPGVDDRYRPEGDRR